MTEISTQTVTPHDAAKRFTVYDMRAARKHYSRTITDHATDSDVRSALLARVLVSSDPRNRDARQAYYASLFASATDATRTLAEAAFAHSLDESDARRDRQAMPQDDQDQDDQDQDQDDQDQDDQD